MLTPTEALIRMHQTQANTGAYLGSFQISMMEHFRENSSPAMPSTIFVKCSIRDVWRSPTYASVKSQ